MKKVQESVTLLKSMAGRTRSKDVGNGDEVHRVTLGNNHTQNITAKTLRIIIPRREPVLRVRYTSWFRPTPELHGFAPLRFGFCELETHVGRVVRYDTTIILTAKPFIKESIFCSV